MKTCPNCGTQVDPRPQCLADVPIEQLVAADDSVRLRQLADPHAPHSANIVAGGPRAQN